MRSANATLSRWLILEKCGWAFAGVETPASPNAAASNDREATATRVPLAVPQGFADDFASSAHNGRMNQDRRRRLFLIPVPGP